MRLHTLDDQVGSENTHGGNTNTRLCGTVSGAEAGEDDGRCAAHGTEEGLYGSMIVSLVLLAFGSAAVEELVQALRVRHCGGKKVRRNIPHTRDYANLHVSTFITIDG